MNRIPFTWWGAVISGLLVGASFPPTAVSITAIPGMALFLLTMRFHRSGHNASVPILLYLFCSWGLAFYWVGTHVIPHVAITSLLVLAALMMVATAASSMGFRLAGIPGLAVGHLAVELLLTYGPVPMPWVSAGYTVSGTLLEPVVTWIGVTGTSALLWTASLLVAARSVKHRIALAVLVVVLGLVVLVFVQMPSMKGDPRANPNTTDLNRPGLQVRLVQPDIQPAEWADIHSWSRVQMLGRLSVGPEVDLVVWPETALPVISELDLTTIHTREVFHSVPRPLLTGGIIHPATEENPEAPMAPWNAAILFQDSAPTRVYAKQKLVPFAEYVPGSQWISQLSVLAVDAGGTAGYVPGDASAYWEIAGWIAVPMICFESVFSALARRQVRGGAEILVVLSQTGWWTSDRAAYQHLAYTSLAGRSVGRPLIVSSVNGPSGVVDASGHLVDSLADGEPDSATFTVPMALIQTPYTTVGEWPVWVIFISLCLLSFFDRRSLVA